jgi:PKD repeat protein
MNKYLIAFILTLTFFYSGEAQKLKKIDRTSTVKGQTKGSKHNGLLSDSPTFRRCIAMEADVTLRKKYPTLPSSLSIEKELQKNIKEYKTRLAKSKVEEEVYVIPVIVHVIHSGQAVGTGPNITAAQVKSQIDVLNEDFRRKVGTAGFNNNAVGADVNIEFALALRDPQGRTLAEPGVDRIKVNRATWDSMEDIQNILKPNTQWDPTKYLNMWTVTYGGDMEDNLGYAQFPVLSGLDGLDDRNAGIASTDGLVMRYSAFGRVGAVEAPYHKGRTTTHEIGHWLGLRHIWGDQEGCTGSDYCSDTPVAGAPNYRCTAGTNSCPDNIGNDMIENYMDYTNDECMNIFTLEQKARMRTVMEKSPRRKELLKSTVHLPLSTSGSPVAAFSVDMTKACAGTSITLKDESTNSPTSWQWYVLKEDSTIAVSSTLQNPVIQLNTAGVYSIVLIAKNAAGQNRFDKENVIDIFSGTAITIPFTGNFETLAVPAGWTAFNPDYDREMEWLDLTDYSWTNTAAFDNYSADTDPTGTTDGMVTSKIDMSLSANKFAELSFDVAYAMYEDEDGIYFDSLVLYYSTDCGQTFTPFWKKWGSDLATGATTGDLFIPSGPTEWRKEKISLSFLNGQSNVQLKIANVSGWGNYLYLDNIQISVPKPTQKPVTAFSTTTTTVCEGSSIKFTDNTTNSPTSWSWTFDGGTPSTSTEQNPVVVYKTAGLYNVSLTTSNALGSNTKTSASYITVVAKPTLQITKDKVEIVEGDFVTLTASGGKNYIWKDKVRGQIGTGTTITIKPVAASTYIVEGENENGCVSNSSIEIMLKPLADDDEIQTNSILSLYPNPTFHDVVVSLNPGIAVQSSKVSIYNSLGILLESKQMGFVDSVWKTSINAGKYAKGTYFIKVEYGGKLIRKSFIKI